MLRNHCNDDVNAVRDTRRHCSSVTVNKRMNHDASNGSAAVVEKAHLPADEATLNSGSCSYLLYQLANSKEIKPVAIAIIELRLSERISKGVSQSCSQ